jgi:hypothetical protein
MSNYCWWCGEDTEDCKTCDCPDCHEGEDKK